MTYMNYIMRGIKVLNISNLKYTKLIKTKNNKKFKRHIGRVKFGKRLGKNGVYLPAAM